MGFEVEKVYIFTCKLVCLFRLNKACTCVNGLYRLNKACTCVNNI